MSYWYHRFSVVHLKRSHWEILEHFWSLGSQAVQYLGKESNPCTQGLIWMPAHWKGEVHGSHLMESWCHSCGPTVDQTTCQALYGLVRMRSFVGVNVLLGHNEGLIVSTFSRADALSDYLKNVIDNHGVASVWWSKRNSNSDETREKRCEAKDGPVVVHGQILSCSCSGSL